MSTATTTEPTTGQHTTNRTTTKPANPSTSQLERSAASRLRTTMAAVRLAFTSLHDGQPKGFRDSAVEYLRDFLEPQASHLEPDAEGSWWGRYGAC